MRRGVSVVVYMKENCEDYLPHIERGGPKSSDNKMFKFALHEKTAKHIRQLTESEFRKTNIRAM
jgi:hypothetical protein